MIVDINSPQTPDLSIIIVNWNSKDYISSCLSSLERHCGDLDYEVIVVDGASFDGCEQMLKDKHPLARYIQSQENIGFGRCNNLGFEHAKALHLLLLNPDTEIQEGSLQALLSLLKNDPKVGAVGAKLLNSDGSLQTSSVQALPTPLNQGLDSNFMRRLFPKSKLWGTYPAYSTDKPTKVEAISGACIAISAALFKKIGGFTKDYFMYAEDMDLCKKVRDEGFDITYQPGALIVHHGGGSSNTQPSEYSTVQKLIAMKIYMHKNQGRVSACTFQGLMLLSALIRIIILSIGWLTSVDSKKPNFEHSLKRWSYVFKWALHFKSLREIV